MSITDHKITEQQIADYGLTSLPDLLTGTAGENKTAMQKLLVMIGIPAINAAIDELALVEAQADDWAVAEAARAAAELLRAAAEEARATAEQGRASAESSRVTAESGRTSAETVRVNAESARVSAESARATNESSRQTAESGRATAESGRASAESTRASSESARVSAESGRATAESGRVSAESGRVSAEAARVTAENNRVNTFATEVQQAQAANTAAQGAATRAETAAEQAEAIAGGKFVPTSEKGAAGGVASLGTDGKVPNAQLPDFDAAGAAQTVQGNLQTHQADAVKHVTATERSTWNGKANASHMQAIAYGGTNANTAAGARANLDTMKPVWAEVTLPATGWTLSGTVYVQTVACAAAAATMKGYPNVGLKKSTDTAAAALEKEAFALIETVDTADGSITATCGDTAPQVAITLLFAGGVA